LPSTGGTMTAARQESRETIVSYPPPSRIRCEYKPGFKTRRIYARPRKAEITSKFEGEISE
jgi:hypothetical protein